MTIRKLYDEVIRQKNKLDNATEQLGKRASEQMAVRPKEFTMAYRLAQNVFMTQKTWKMLYNMIVGGDPKGRTYRAIATELQIARKDRS